MAGNFTVILKDPYARADLPAAGRLLAEVLRVPVIDAMQIIRRRFGKILAEQLEYEQAERFVSALHGAGSDAISIPSGEMVALVALGAAQRLEYHDAHLRVIVGSPGKVSDIPWDDIRILMLGQVQIETTTSKVEQVKSVGLKLRVGFGGVGIGLGESSEPVVTHDKQVDRWLLTGVIALDGRFISLPGKGLIYTHLGDRIKQQSIENYRTVLSDISSFCPEAFATESFESFLEGGPIPTYPNPRAIEEEGLWLLQLDRLGILQTL